MTDLNAAELSGLLDGELDSARASAAEAALAADAALSAEFERLKQADRQLRYWAEAAAFHPRIHLPAAEVRPVPNWFIACLGAVFTAWTVGKLAPAMTLAVVVNASAMLVLIAWLAPLALREGWNATPSQVG